MNAIRKLGVISRHKEKIKASASALFAVVCANGAINSVEPSQPIETVPYTDFMSLLESHPSTDLRLNKKHVSAVFLIGEDAEPLILQAAHLSIEKAESDIAFTGHDTSITYGEHKEAEPLQNPTTISLTVLAALAAWFSANRRHHFTREVSQRWNARRDPKQSLHVCYHEAGHALLAYKLDLMDEGAYVAKFGNDECPNPHLNSNDFKTEHGSLPDEDFLKKRIMISYGGMAAEEVVYGAFTNGGMMDIHHNSYRIVQDYLRAGYFKTMPLLISTSITFEQGQTMPEFPFSELLRRELDDEIIRIATSCKDAAVQTLENHREELDALAYALYKKGFLNAQEIAEIIENPQAPPQTELESLMPGI